MSVCIGDCVCVLGVICNYVCRIDRNGSLHAEIFFTLQTDSSFPNQTHHEIRNATSPLDVPVDAGDHNGLSDVIASPDSADAVKGI